jgi:outer membrane protein assembly factor BamB
MPDRGAARTPRPVTKRRRVSARVRRRRALVAAIVVALVVEIAVLSAPKHNRAHAATSNVRPTRTTTTPARVVAVETPWPLGAALSRATAVTMGSDMFVMGGIGTNQASSAAVLRVDPAAGTVALAGALAMPTHDAASGVLNGRPYVFGGGAQHVYDAVQLVSTSGTSTVVAHLPQPRADLSAVTVGSTVYLVGGYDGTNATRDVLATNDGMNFRVVAPLPIGVRYPAVSALGNTIYVFGGEWANQPTAAVQSIDLQTNRARVIAQLPEPRTQAAAFTLAGSIYIAGGNTTSGPSATVLRFDSRRARFTSATMLPDPIADAASATSANGAYVFGGEALGMSSGVVRVSTTTASNATLAATTQRPFVGQLLIADRGDNRLIVVDAQKRLHWVYPAPGRPAPPGGFYFPDDGFFADHGRAIVSNEEDNNTVVRIGYPSGALLWSYGTPKVAGSGPGLLNQPDDAFLLPDHRIMVADAKNCRVLFIGANAQPVSQIGTTGDCTHAPPTSLGYPNGDTPLANGDLLVSEIDGSWISEYTQTGHLVWTVHLPIAYPSDPQQLGPDLYLVADYTSPGGVLEFNREGQILWEYRPAPGPGSLDHPSLAERLPNGLIGVNDDYRHRVILIDPATSSIVWQYGQTDSPGTGTDQLNIPDGFDLLLPDRTTPTHLPTG